MLTVSRMIDQIMQGGNFDLQWANDYAEPGYSCDETKGIFFADWNDRTRYNSETREHETLDSTPSRVCSILEAAGYEIEWCDEWTECDECGRAVRIQPDSYSWRPSFVLFNDCEIVCSKCVENDTDAYLDHLLNNPETADTFGIDWTEHGFTRNDEIYENGFHPGQNDDPKAIAESLPAGVDYLFSVDSVGQFDMRFSLWTRTDEETE